MATHHTRTKSSSTPYRPIAPLIASAGSNWQANGGSSNSNQRELRIRDSASPTINHFHMDETMDDLLSTDQKTRRKEQNRAAQRAFRERKERYVKELETKIKDMEIEHTKALASKEKEIETLLYRVTELENELNKIKGVHNNNSNNNNNNNHIDITTSALQATTIHDDYDYNNNRNDNNNDDNKGNHTNDQNNSLQNNNDDTMMMLINDDDDTDSELHDLDMMEQKQVDNNRDDDDDQFLKYLPKYHQYNKPLSSAVACIRDKDGHSFCERLKEEVCSSAFNQLLSEPLFDASGTFNEKVTDHPVPIVTERIKENNSNSDYNSNNNNNNNNNNSNNNSSSINTLSFLDRLNESLANDDNFDFSSPHPDTLLPNNELITCAIAWKSLSTHPKFEVIDVDMLCTELKKIAKCSNTGPVFSQHDLNIVLKWMDTIS